MCIRIYVYVCMYDESSCSNVLWHHSCVCVCVCVCTFLYIYVIYNHIWVFLWHHSYVYLHLCVCMYVRWVIMLECFCDIISCAYESCVHTKYRGYLGQGTCIHSKHTHARAHSQARAHARTHKHTYTRNTGGIWDKTPVEFSLIALLAMLLPIHCLWFYMILRVCVCMLWHTYVMYCQSKRSSVILRVYSIWFSGYLCECYNIRM